MNKIVVISGASQGIGSELYSLFEQSGDTPVSLSRTNRANHKNFVECDVSDEQSVKAAALAVKERFGNVDILINNAGKGISGASELLPTDKIREVMDTDYYGTLFLTREILSVLSEKGRIINISSACALFALPFRSVYCSAKAAVNMLSFGQRMELKNTGIKVVCVCPGDIKSTFTANRLKFADTNSRYGDRISRAAEKIDTREHKRMDVKAASKKIYKIALKKNKALYIIGGKYKAFYFFQKILPTNLFVKILGKFFG